MFMFMFMFCYTFSSSILHVLVILSLSVHDIKMGYFDQYCRSFFFEFGRLFT